MNELLKRLQTCCTNCSKRATLRLMVNEPGWKPTRRLVNLRDRNSKALARQKSHRLQFGAKELIRYSSLELFFIENSILTYFHGALNKLVPGITMLHC